MLLFAFGLAAGVFLAYSGLGFAEGSVSVLVTTFFVTALGFCAIAALLFLFRRRILAWLFGVAETHIESFAEPLGAVADNAIKGNAEAAVAAARLLTQRVLARYAWITTRRWIITSLTALVAALAALAGTALLFEQNRLLRGQTAMLQTQTDRLEDQNQLIGVEIQLAEAARNAGLAVEISAIAGELGTTLDTFQASLDPPLESGAIAVLPADAVPAGLKARIVSASIAAQPYSFLNSGIRERDDAQNLRHALARRIDLPETQAKLEAARLRSEGTAISETLNRPLSPERGQLLAAMMTNGLRQTEDLSFAGMDLSFARVRAPQISLTSLQLASLNYSEFAYLNISDSDFGGATLNNASFAFSVIEDTTFASLDGNLAPPLYFAPGMIYATRMSGTDFSGTLLANVQFIGASLIGANFNRAMLVDVDFTDASPAAATFINAVLLNVNFANADLKSVDFDGAFVFDANFLENLAAFAVNDTFALERFKLDPATLDDVYTVAAAFSHIDAEIPLERIQGKPVFKITRITPFQ